MLLVSKKILMFCDLYFNVTGNLYSADGRAAYEAGTAGIKPARTNLWKYFGTAAAGAAGTQANCVSPPSHDNVTLVNCPIAHCCSSSTVKISSRAITAIPQQYYDAVSRLLPKWMCNND